MSTRSRRRVCYNPRNPRHRSLNAESAFTTPKTSANTGVANGVDLTAPCLALARGLSASDGGKAHVLAGLTSLHADSPNAQRPGLSTASPAYQGRLDSRRILLSGWNMPVVDNKAIAETHPPTSSISRVSIGQHGYPVYSPRILRFCIRDVLRLST